MGLGGGPQVYRTIKKNELGALEVTPKFYQVTCFSVRIPEGDTQQSSQH